MAQVNFSETDHIQIDRDLDSIGDIDVQIKQSESTIRAMSKGNANVKLLRTIPGIGEFLARLIEAEVDDMSALGSRAPQIKAADRDMLAGGAAQPSTPAAVVKPAERSAAPANIDTAAIFAARNNKR